MICPVCGSNDVTLVSITYRRYRCQSCGCRFKIEGEGGKHG